MKQELAKPESKIEEEKQVLSSTKSDPQKTTGEKYYGILKFAVAEVVMVAATAITAYWAKYGSRSTFNIFGHMQDGAEKFFSPLKKLGKEGSKLRKNGTIFAAIAASA